MEAQAEIRIPLDGGGVVVGTDRAKVEQAAKDINAQRQRERETERLFPGERKEKIAALCKLFPTLATDVAFRGIEPWNVDKFLLWAVKGSHCSGEVHAIRFVLSVWNPSTDWIELLERKLDRERPDDPRDRVLWDGLQKLRDEARECLEGNEQPSSPADVERCLRDWCQVVGPFSVSQAFGTWDDKHRTAFLTWCQHPFWP